MSTRTSSRGSALLTAVIVILVITAIGVAMVRMTWHEVAGSTAGAREQALVACAEAARVQLLSKFHALGFQPTLVAPLTGEKLGSNGNTVAVGGHYDSASGSIMVEQISYLPENSAGPSTSVRDISNISSLIGQGGKPIKVTVLCKDGTGGGRQLEVEFGVRFGL